MDGLGRLELAADARLELTSLPWTATCRGKWWAGQRIPTPDYFPYEVQAGSRAERPTSLRVPDLPSRRSRSRPIPTYHPSGWMLMTAYTCRVHSAYLVYNAVWTRQFVLHLAVDMRLIGSYSSDREAVAVSYRRIRRAGTGL